MTRISKEERDQMGTMKKTLTYRAERQWYVYTAYKELIERIRKPDGTEWLGRHRKSIEAQIMQLKKKFRQEGAAIFGRPKPKTTRRLGYYELFMLRNQMVYYTIEQERAGAPSDRMNGTWLSKSRRPGAWKAKIIHHPSQIHLPSQNIERSAQQMTSEKESSSEGSYSHYRQEGEGNNEEAHSRRS